LFALDLEDVSVTMAGFARPVEETA